MGTIIDIRDYLKSKLKKSLDSEISDNEYELMTGHELEKRKLDTFKFVDLEDTCCWCEKEFKVNDEIVLEKSLDLFAPSPDEQFNYSLWHLECIVGNIKERNEVWDEDENGDDMV
jgi:hypothetical protein